MYINIIFILFVFGISFINGLTDAVNSVSSLYFLGKYKLKFISLLSGIFNFIGCFISCLYFSHIVNSISKLVDFGVVELNKNILLTSNAIISVLIFATICWYYGLATSESHALLGAICGVSLFINPRKQQLMFNIIDVLKEQFFSLVFGFIAAFLINLVIKQINITHSNNIYFLNCILISLLHGAQDGQKFFCLVLLAFPSITLQTKILFIIIISFFIGVGTFFCSEKIIKKVNSISSINRNVVLSSDISNIISMLLVTIKGLPISSTYIKISSFLGGSFSEYGKINKRITFEIFISWILTFPTCMIVSYLICLITI